MPTCLQCRLEDPGHGEGRSYQGKFRNKKNSEYETKWDRSRDTFSEAMECVKSKARVLMDYVRWFGATNENTLLVSFCNRSAGWRLIRKARQLNNVLAGAMVGGPHDQQVGASSERHAS